jgi:hypothetical protein
VPAGTPYAIAGFYFPRELNEMRGSSTKQTTATVSRAQAERLADLIPGEKLEDCEALHARVLAAVEPRDALEELWVEDVAVLTWEIKRLRRIKAGIIRTGMASALKPLLQPAGDYLAVSDLVDRWSIRDPAAVRKVDEVLATMQLTMDDVAARAMELKIRTVDTVNAMVMQAETRRKAALREIERRRDLLAARLRAAAAIEDAEFEEVPPRIQAISGANGDGAQGG